MILSFYFVNLIYLLTSHLFLSFFLCFFFYIFLYPTFFCCSLSLFISFALSFSPLGLLLISVCVLVMSIDSKFVFELIVSVMVIMLVHSTCQKCIHVGAWLAPRVVHESTTFKGIRESVRCLASQAFSLSS